MQMIQKQKPYTSCHATLNHTQLFFSKTRVDVFLTKRFWSKFIVQLSVIVRFPISIYRDKKIICCFIRITITSHPARVLLRSICLFRGSRSNSEYKEKTNVQVVILKIITDIFFDILFLSPKKALFEPGKMSLI